MISPERLAYLLDQDYENIQDIRDRKVHPRVIHQSRGWSDTRLEDECPCPKGPCGFAQNPGDKECNQHGYGAAKTIRRTHPAVLCSEFMTVHEADVKAGAKKKDDLLKRRMRNIVILPREAEALLNELTSDPSVNEREWPVPVVDLIRKMAEHIGKNPNHYTPLLNRHQYPHDWAPSMFNHLLCHWCEKDRQGSFFHKTRDGK